MPTANTFPPSRERTRTSPGNEVPRVEARHVVNLNLGESMSIPLPQRICWDHAGPMLIAAMMTSQSHLWPTRNQLKWKKKEGHNIGFETHLSRVN